jgi:signal transduction histidine kinase
MRRLFGPVGGPITFVLVAALAFGGLAWVTVASLRVEEAQQRAAAQADLGNNLRVALWRLDGRMLPALGVEDSRPFYHYESADPLSGSTAGPTPLLAAPLPDWMKLHVQLDPATGWDSPQVLAPEARERIEEAWPDLPLRNATPDRAAVLAALRGKYPVRPTADLLAAREQANPADARPFAAPLVDPLPQQQADATAALVPPGGTGPKPPPPPEMGPVVVPGERPSEPFRLFGWEFPRREALAADLPRDNRKLNDLMVDAATPKSQQPAPPTKPPAFPPQVAPPGGAVGRSGYPLTEEQRQKFTDFRNRAQTLQKATDDAKNAGQEFPQYGRGAYQQNAMNPAGNGIYNNSAAPGFNKPDKDGKDRNAYPPGDPRAEALKKNLDEEVKRLLELQGRNTLSGRLAALTCGAAELERLSGDTRKQLALEDERRILVLEAAWAAARAAAGLKPPRPVPPAEDRPLPAFNEVGNLTQIQNNSLITNALQPVGRTVSIHLGSMRPQWITAADGTEMLVLLRAADLDGKTVYQGVVLDWPTLEQVLKEEVKDLFPEARLVPVRDPASVSHDRAMTALPVQLDPGPGPAPEPARWTTLRLGLVLAWVAALVALAAVGLSGWSLIDLAERRIRFVSAVTHELRTPLTSLRLYLDLLMSGMIHDEAKRQEYLNTLATESDRLHRLIDNVLDFAKLEKRAKNGDMKPVKVGEFVEQLRSTWADRAAADGKELVVVSTLPPETEVLTDAAMVQQIVGNLIDNARKYTRDAADRRIWLWAKPGGGGRVAFEVEDRGAGVPPGERKSIFKPFRRGGQADAKAGGAGLGLALAKQWAEVLGGTLSYRPADGAPGACFRRELPAKS